MLLRISSKKSFFCPTIKEFGYLRNTSFFTSKTKNRTQEETDVLSCAQLNSISWGAQVLAGKVIGKTKIDLSLKCTPSSKYLFVCTVLKVPVTLIPRYVSPSNVEILLILAIHSWYSSQRPLPALVFFQANVLFHINCKFPPSIAYCSKWQIALNPSCGSFSCSVLLQHKPNIFLLQMSNISLLLISCLDQICMWAWALPEVCI